MLAINNIKKSKNAAITLIILIMLSIAFSYIGSSVVLNLGSFFDNKVKELNDANVSFITNNNDVFEKTYSFLKNNAHTKKVETEDILSLDTASFKSGNKDITTQFVICDADNKRTLSSLTLIEKAKEKPQNSIFLSYNFKAGFGYKVGDKITIKSNNKSKTFTVYGFFEDTLYSNNSDTLISKAYLFHDDYEKLKTSFPITKCKILKAKTDTTSNAHLVRKLCVDNLSKELAGKQYNIEGADSVTAKGSLYEYTGILMAILIAFSIVLVVIALIVIGFSIVTYIEDNIKNIGVLQAIGYVNSQVISISLMQFMIIAVLGSILGIIIAFRATPFVSNIVSSMAGLNWASKINVSEALLCVISVLLLVLLITYLSARRIKKITPIVALRSGMATHSFKKNHIKLDGYKGSLNFAISLKTIFHYIRQNCMIAVIIFVLTFVSIFGTVTYYNFVVNSNFLMNMIGIENIDIQLEAHNGTSKKVYNEVKANENVRKVIKLFDKSFLLNDESTRLYVCDDYSKLENKVIYSGREPIHDNEIAISNTIAKSMNKNIGDTISIKIDGISKDFLVVGLSQHMTGFGRSIRITENGYHRYYPDFNIPTIGVYMKNTSDIKDFIKVLNTKYTNEDVTVTNYNVLIESLVEPFKAPVKLLVSVFIAITVVIVCLILLLLIKIRLLKDRKHLGISKALGYTTMQLVLQTVFSLMPVVITGVLLGSIGGCLLSNSLMAAIVSSMGIYNCSLTINYTYVTLVVIGIIAVAYFFASFVAYRIRKISPYELME